MADNNNGRRGDGQGGAVILGRDIFAKRLKQNQARAQARRYFEATRRAAIQRQLVLRLLNRERAGPEPHSED